MRLQRWLLPVVVVLAVLVGIAIAGLPKKEPTLHLKPLSSTTTTQPAAVAPLPTTLSTTTAPLNPGQAPTTGSAGSSSTTTTR